MHVLFAAGFLVGCSSGAGSSDPSGGGAGATGGKAAGGKTGAASGGTSGGNTGGGPATGGSSSGTGGGSAGAGGGAGGSAGGSGGTSSGSGGAAGAEADAGGTTDVAAPPGDDGGSGPTFEGTHPACPNCKAAFNGKDITGWIPVGDEKWAVEAGGIASTGAGAGVLVSPGKYDHYRLIYSWKMASAAGHQATMVVWCRDLKARYCAGVQFQPPGTDIWDYGPANASLAKKAGLKAAPVPKGEAGQCEMIVNATAGTFKVACCNLGTGKTCKGQDVGMLTYGMPMPKAGFAFQAHNAGHKIRWWDIFIEENPASDDFVTTK